MDTKVVVVIIIGLVVIYIWTQRNSQGLNTSHIPATPAYFPPPPPVSQPLPEPEPAPVPQQQQSEGYESFGFGNGAMSTGGLFKLPYSTTGPLPPGPEPPQDPSQMGPMSPLQQRAGPDMRQMEMMPAPTNPFMSGQGGGGGGGGSPPQFPPPPPQFPPPRGPLPPPRPSMQHPSPPPPPPQPRRQGGQGGQEGPAVNPQVGQHGAVLSQEGPDDGLSTQFDSLFSSDESSFLKKR